MKALVLFYSYTGHSERLAQTYAAQEQADLVEIKEIRRPGWLRTYILGSFAAMRGKPWPIQPLDIDWQAYDRLVLFAPVWAGNPPPAVHALLAVLPAGKSVAIKLVSASGQSNCRQRLQAALTAVGSILDQVEDIKA